MPVPSAALREAVLNAIVHKDYASASPIQISVYDDKVMIWNNAELYQNWTVENLYAKHASQPYNPDIANTFFRSGLIEAWGRGIEKMSLACKKHGSPTPELKHEAGGLWITFGYIKEKTPPEMTEEMTEEMPVKTPVEILKLLDKKPQMTLAKIAKTNVTHIRPSHTLTANVI